MEFHQVRYFLAVCQTLNFTRAAEDCNVSQPSLSRAVKLLEAELGGELFRRERTLTHLTDLGQTVLPALRQAYESTLAAKSLAKSHLKEGHAPLRLALSRSLDMEVLAPMLAEITKAFPRIEIKMFRGPPHEIDDKMKSGEAEIAIAGDLGDGWERYDAKGLYVESFGLLISRHHALANQERIALRGLVDQRLLCRPNCAMADRIVVQLKASGAKEVATHEVPQIDDMTGLVRANFGVGILPIGRKVPDDLVASEIDGVDLERKINVITVAGRPHTPAAAALKTLLRARDWAAMGISGRSGSARDGREQQQ